MKTRSHSIVQKRPKVKVVLIVTPISIDDYVSCCGSDGIVFITCMSS